MAKKKKIDLKLIVAEALDYYHNYVKKTIKESTKRQNESLLSEFYRFVDTLPARDRTMKIFSQKGLNRYKEYLIDKMERSKTDGKKRNFGVGQLNRCGSMIARLINNVLKPEEVVPNHVDWMKVEDTRREDQKGHFPLLENEVTAIENCSGLTPAEEEYRDIFLLQIECGQRVSDLAKILTGKYRVKQGKKFKYIIISTIKENIKAHIPLRPKMRMWMGKVNSHKLITPVKFEKIVNGKGNGIYNQAIRRIVKKAGLDREIVRINSLLLEVRGPLYEEITNHAARCTFITNMLKKGVSTERLSKMTGHASDEMIKRVYAQLTEDDEINLIESDLYSDMDDDVANIPTDSSSIYPSELESAGVVSEEMPNRMLNNANEMPTVLISSDRPNDLKSYIEGLKDIVDSSLGIINDDDLDYSELLNHLKQRSEEVHIEGGKPQKCVRVKDLLKDMPKDDLSVIGDVLIASLAERIKQSKQKEQRGLFPLINTFSSNYSLLRRINIFGELFKKMIPYMMYNRPIVDEKQLEFTHNKKLKHRLDLALVLRELQKVSHTKLEMIIAYTDCPQNTQRRLLNAIATGDLVDFSETIHKFKSETTVLINYAYNLNYVNNELLYPCNKAEDLENICTEEGFDYSFNKESLQTLWGELFDFFQAILKHANMSEKRILNNVSKQIEKYPELKEAYDEYKVKQNTLPEPKQKEEGDVLQNPGNDQAPPKDHKDKDEVNNFITFSKNNLDIDKLVRLLTEDNEINGNQCLISLLQCDNKDSDVKTCLEHFLGYKSSPGLSFRLKWNRDNNVGLKFLIRLLVNTNNKATRRNVIKYKIVDGVPKPYDGFSKYVSDGTGQTGIWPSVRNVFYKCGSIMQAGLGKTESAWKKNTKQLKIVADIYFECKKKTPSSK